MSGHFVDKGKVSIIVPCYNSAKYIEDTIKSVLTQTYSNWEMIIVDDCSTDGSSEIISKYMAVEPRLKYIKLSSPSGSPTTPRNTAIGVATGRFIAFLDSDDLWLPTKLHNQIIFFESNSDAAIVFSNYEKINESGVRQGRVIWAPSRVTYNLLLHGNVIGNLTGMYDTEKVGKVFMQFVGHEDYVLWLSILKKGFIAANTNTVEALYRVRGNSVSSNKLKAFRWTWNIYYNIEKLGFIRSLYYFVIYSIKAIFKHLS